MLLQKNIGVLGAGQLGKMLALAAGNWHLPLQFLDTSQDMPAAGVCPNFVMGDFKKYEDVYRFGLMVDILTIEIEHVNTQALWALQRQGKQISPSPACIDTIKDKGLQKQFYRLHGIPTAGFQCFENAGAVIKSVHEGKIRYPFVQKSRMEGYDGRGVVVVRQEADLSRLLENACVVEELVDISKELAVVVARNLKGESVAYPVVEMLFHPEANLVDMLACPAGITAGQADRAEKIALEVAEKLGVCGLLAVELFLTTTGEILVNESAPRPHNSGHHTIDSCYTSQYEQHLRAILDLPLGSTYLKSPSVMVNLLGSETANGIPEYHGLQECLNLAGVELHLYGKKTVKPFRKMGHVTVLAPTMAEALEKAAVVKKKLVVGSR